MPVDFLREYPGPDDASLRRAGMYRLADETPQVAWARQLRDSVVGVFHGDGEHVLTQADIDAMYPADRSGSGPYREYLRRYRGLPVKYIGARDDPDIWNSLDNRIKVAYMLARHVGKSVDQEFTQADLDRLAEKFGWDAEHKAVFAPYVGKTFLGATKDFAANLLQSIVDGVTNIPGTDINPLGALQGLNDIIGFVNDRKNWMAMLGGAAGLALLVFGGIRFMRGEGMS